MQDAFENLSFAARAAFLAVSLRYADGDLNQPQFLAIWLFLLLRFHAVAVAAGRLHAGSQDASEVLAWIEAQPTDTVTLHVQDGAPPGKQGEAGDYGFDTSSEGIWQKKPGGWLLLASLAATQDDPGADLSGVVVRHDIDAAVDAVSVQRPFAESFATAVAGGRYEAVSETGEAITDTAAVARRAAAYVIALRVTANQAWIDALPGGTLFTWVLGAAEHHCGDCPSWAAGGPYGADDLPALPGDGSSECGIGCKCDLETTDGDPGLQHYDDTGDDDGAATDSANNAGSSKHSPRPSRSVSAMNKSTEPQKVIKSFAVKSGAVTGNRLECIPSVMGNLDLYADVIFPPKKMGRPGPFARCLPDFLRRGFNPMDHKWEWTEIVGYPVSAQEQGNKLVSVMEFHSDQKSQDALTKCKERLAANKEVGLSIGFTVMPRDVVYFSSGSELLAYAKSGGWDLSLFDVPVISAWNAQCSGILEIEELWEYSLTPCPANQQAMAVAVKSYNTKRTQAERISPAVTAEALSGRAAKGDIRVTNTKIKSICGSLSLDLAPRDTKWSAADAVKRLKEHFGATEEPNNKLAKCFVVLDGPADEFGSYKLPFADVIGGEVKAVFGAVKAIAGVLEGARGGVDIQDQDREGAKRFVENYYAKAAKEYDDDEIKVPWAGDASGKSVKWKGQYLGNYVEMNMCMGAMYEAFMSLYYEISDALCSSGAYSGMEDNDVLDALQGMHDEFSGLCMSVYRAIMSGSADEDPTMAAKTIKGIVLQVVGGLGDGLPYTKSAKIAVDAVESLIERTEQRAAMRRKEGRELSEANYNTLKDHREQLGKALATLDDLLERTEPKSKQVNENADRANALRQRFLRNSFAG